MRIAGRRKRGAEPGQLRLEGIVRNPGLADGAANVLCVGRSGHSLIYCRAAPNCWRFITSEATSTTTVITTIKIVLMAFTSGVTPRRTWL